VGLHQEAIEKGAVAVASNPDDPMTIWSLGHSKQLAGEFEEAKEYFARTLRLEPTHVWGNIFFPGVHLLFRAAGPRGGKRFASRRNLYQKTHWLPVGKLCYGPNGVRLAKLSKRPGVHLATSAF